MYVDERVRLDPDAVETAFRVLLASERRAAVTAIDSHGLFVPLPASLGVHGHPALDARSALDLVDTADRTTVIDAWDRVREIGATHARVRLRGGHDTTLYFFDLREHHGLLVGALVGESEHGIPAATEHVSIAPRVSIQRKNDVAVLIDVDDATTQMLGWSREEMVGHPSLDFVHPDDHDRAIESWMDMLSNSGTQRRARLRYRRSDNTWMWLELTNQNLLSEADGCVVTEALDVSEEMAAHEAVRAQEQLLRRIAETVPLGLLHLDRNGDVLYANERLHEILGAAKIDGDSSPFATIVAQDRDHLDEALAQLMLGGADRDLEVGVRTRRRGDDRRCDLRLRALSDPDGIVTGAIVCVEDITDRARSRAELEHRATFDPLTGCLNRASVLQVVDSAFATVAPLGVIFLDLDGFKLVNDLHGHATGDVVLIEAVRRIKECIRDGDVLGRLGGDEFLVVCPGSFDRAGAMVLADRIADAFGAPLLLGDVTVTMRASIGVAIVENDAATAEDLIANADAAMYTSKRNGDGRPVSH